MPKPTLKVNRTIRSEQVLEAFIRVIRPHLPLDLQGTRITASDINTGRWKHRINRFSASLGSRSIFGHLDLRVIAAHSQRLLDIWYGWS